MTFPTFMVYFREGGLCLPCPLVQRDKGPVFTLFFWVDVRNNCGARSICLALETFCMYNRYDFDFSKIGLHFAVNSFIYPVGEDLTPRFPLRSLRRQFQLFAIAPHSGAAERTCAVRGLLGPRRLQRSLGFRHLSFHLFHGHARNHPPPESSWMLRHWVQGFPGELHKLLLTVATFRLLMAGHFSPQTDLG